LRDIIKFPPDDSFTCAVAHAVWRQENPKKNITREAMRSRLETAVDSGKLKKTTINGGNYYFRKE